MTAHLYSWTARARDVPIERETERRGIKLRGAVDRVGPCPKCGGEGRFAINTKKGVWNCRGCGVGGDGVEMGDPSGAPPDRRDLAFAPIALKCHRSRKAIRD